ncbi:DUF2332 domain-containing protein [Solibacillus silvestris]|uniref:DUF2332 domain-containing protein n=1 Tax=Solibacillus silvestris TaxID=76853 RepID=UPI003F81EE24
MNQPKPNLFFAAVQYLAQKTNDPLTQVFQCSGLIDFNVSFDLLKGFWRAYEAVLINILQTKFVQTNEVQRSAYLYPVFHEIYERAQKPLTLIEIGTSAGLLLNLDLFQYEISQDENRTFGDFSSSMKISAANYGAALPKMEPFRVFRRCGIDLNIIDLSNEEDYLWLQSLIWPEQKDRKKNLEIVRSIHNECEKELYEGNFLHIIPGILDSVCMDSQIVIFHTHVANQFPAQLKEDLIGLLTKESAKQPIYHVYNNMYDSNLHVDFIANRDCISHKVLKNTDGHGNFFYWE